MAAATERQSDRIPANDSENVLQAPPPLRVAFLTPMPSPYIQDLFDAMHRDGRIEPRVFYMEMAAPNTHWSAAALPGYATLLPGRGFEACGVRTHVNPHAVALIAQSNPDLVVVGGYTSLTCQLVMRWLRRSRLPWVFWGERPGITRQGALRRLFRRVAMAPAIRWPHGVAAIGELARRSYQSLVSQDCLVESIPYCCDVSGFMAIDRRGISASSPPELRLLYCGQLIPRKGVDLLISAFCKAAAGESNASLTLVGTGPLESQLRSSIPDSLRNRVQFAGFRPISELPRYFAQANVFVLPSLHDGWGVVVNQAIAAGLAVVASDAVGAAVELVKPRENGILVAAGDLGELTGAIQSLVAAPETVRRMGLASRRVADEVAPLAIVDRWFRFLTSVRLRHRR